MENVVKVLEKNNFIFKEEISRTNDMSCELVFEYKGTGHLLTVLNYLNIPTTFVDVENNIIMIKEYRILAWFMKYSGSADIDYVATEIYDLEEAKQLFNDKVKEFKEKYKYSSYESLTLKLVNGRKIIEKEYILC